VQNGMTELDPEQKQALRTGFVKQDAKEIRAAAGIGTGSAGGYLVPQGFRQSIVEKMKAYGAVQQVATVLNTNTGAVLPWPTNDDTGNVGALLAENTAAAEQDVTLGTAQLGAYKYTSKLVRVSLEFLQDVDWLDVEGFLQRKFAERLGRIHNQHLTTGTGSSQPQGIVTGAVSGVTAAGVAVFTADELIDLQHSVDPAYRNERSKFMLSDTALKLARKLKDSQNRYLFQPGGVDGTAAGMPDTIAGSSYVVNQDMAVPATGVKSVLYGDFQAGYVVRLVKAFELIRLEERFAEFGQTAFIAFDRLDGLVQDNSAYKALTQA
jgi:HK97 family phage major capsid protein